MTVSEEMKSTGQSENINNTDETEELIDLVRLEELINLVQSEKRQKAERHEEAAEPELSGEETSEEFNAPDGAVLPETPEELLCEEITGAEPVELLTETENAEEPEALDVCVGLDDEALSEELADLAMMEELDSQDAADDGEDEDLPEDGGIHLTVIQKCLAVVCVLLSIIILGVAGFRALFVEPELPGAEDKKPPAFEDTSHGTGSTEGPREELIYDIGVVPKVSGERKSDKYYTILVLGRDTGGGGNTDTMLLASYDVTNQKATVMSIPRDTMVNVSWDGKKINSVYNTYGKGNKGLQAVYKEISQLVGFEPDYEVVVEWEAVGAIVDAIGGVWFDVPYHMDYHDPYQDLVIEQEKGYRLLNGEDAMQVIRWRKNDSDSPYGNVAIADSGRMKMQQEFLKAVIQQLMKAENVARIRDIAKVFEENVQTSLSFQNILWFGMQAVQGGLGVEDITFVTMPYSYADVYSRNLTERLGTYSTLAYVVPRAEALLELVNTSLNPFKESFTLEDLDIMYVNADGSIGSTSGEVADQKATLPAPKPAETEKPSSEAGSGGMTDAADPAVSAENMPTESNTQSGNGNGAGVQ